MRATPGSLQRADDLQCNAKNRARARFDCSLKRRASALGRWLVRIRWRTVHQLDDRHGRLVARAKPAFENTQITAWPLAVTCAKLAEQLRHAVPVAQAIEREPPAGQVVALGEGDGAIESKLLSGGARWRDRWRLGG